MKRKYGNSKKRTLTLHYYYLYKRNIYILQNIQAIEVKVSPNPLHTQV